MTAHRLYASGPRRPVSLLENPTYNHLESDPDEPIAYWWILMVIRKKKCFTKGAQRSFFFNIYILVDGAFLKENHTIILSIAISELLFYWHSWSIGLLIRLKAYFLLASGLWWNSQLSDHFKPISGAALLHFTTKGKRAPGRGDLFVSSPLRAAVVAFLRCATKEGCLCIIWGKQVSMCMLSERAAEQ